MKLPNPIILAFIIPLLLIIGKTDLTTREYKSKAGYVKCSLERGGMDLMSMVKR